MSSSMAGGGGTTSTVSAETTAGSHVFKVQGYSQRHGKAITSSAFTIGGHSWRIQYLPCGGCSCTGTGWICFVLHQDRRAADDCGSGGVMVKAVYRLSLLDADGGELYTRVSSRPREISRISTSYGCHFGGFIRSETFDRFYLKADCFSIRCDITVLLETLHNESVLPSPDLYRHLGGILSSSVGGDVTFEIGKATFVAHKNVLAARSPVFMAKFFGGMMEEKAATAHVRILGIHTMAFKAMLHFIYTDSLPEIDDDDKIAMAQHLLVAADIYGIERLKLICENKLCGFVNASVVATTLVLAEKHGCRGLKDACFKFLKHGENFKALGYDDYNYVKRCCPSLLNEFLAERAGL